MPIFIDSLYVAISPATIDIDPKETLDTDDPQLRMLYYDFEFETPEDVTFRTSVCMQRGLELAQVAMAPGRLPARVAGRLVRPETGAEDLKRFIEEMVKRRGLM